MVMLFSFLGAQLNLSLISTIKASRSLKETWFAGAWLSSSSPSCRHSSKNLSTSSSPYAALVSLLDSVLCLVMSSSSVRTDISSLADWLDWSGQCLRVLLMFCSAFVTGVYLSVGLNEFQLKAKLGDLIECLERSGQYWRLKNCYQMIWC